MNCLTKTKPININFEYNMDNGGNDISIRVYTSIYVILCELSLL